MIATLKALRKKAVIGFVGGSDLVKIAEQLEVGGVPGKYHVRSLFKNWVAITFNDVYSPLVVEDFDFAFAENGLTAYKLGKPLSSQSFIKFVGEDRYKPLVNFILHYIADLDIPIKRYAQPLPVITYGMSHLDQSILVGRLLNSEMA